MIVCVDCQQHKPIENRDLWLCATCNKKRRDQEELDIYRELRIYFLKKCMARDAVCPVHGTPITLDSDIHHKMGKVGYADDWARENDISLLIDVRYWLAVNRAGHNEITEHSREAIEKGLSVSRFSKKP